MDKNRISEAIYLSLVDKESKAANKRISEVENCIKMQYNKFSEQNYLKYTTDWNEGNHFKDAPLRIARGFVWILNNI